MSSLTEFLIAHQQPLGAAYAPLMTLYILAVISPLWSCYLLICSIICIAPKERYPLIEKFSLYLRLIIDSLLNPCSLVLYWYLCPYFLSQYKFFNYLFYTNSLGNQSIVPYAYFSIVLILYFAWYELNKILFKKIKPGIDFSKEYLINFYSPSRIFGSAAILIVMFDFEPHISYLLWNNVYIGVAISIIRYGLSIRYALATSNFLLSNR